MAGQTDLKVCFIGAGSMVEAIVRGLVQKEIFQASNITLLNRSNFERLQSMREQYGVSIVSNPEHKLAAIGSADIVVLGMKPKDVVAAIQDFRGVLRAEQLIVSVVAGLTIETLQYIVGFPIPVARTMPNTSSTIGLGATGICFSKAVNDAQRSITRKLFEAVGIVSEVEEKLIDVIVSVSGSGPAYVYYLMEAMTAAGIRGGLNEETAQALTVQTVLGAANMVMKTGEKPSALRAKVTSPNGTTQAAIDVLDQADFFETVIQAALRAAERADEMGDAITEQAHQGDAEK